MIDHAHSQRRIILYVCTMYILQNIMQIEVVHFIARLAMGQ